MNKSFSHLFILLSLFLFFPTFIFAARRYGEEETHIALRQIRDSLEDLKHEVHNHEIEIRRYEDKLLNQDTIVDSLRRSFNETAQIHQSKNLENSQNLDLKISSLESATKGLVADLKQFKTHSLEIGQSLAQSQEKIQNLEKYTEHLNRQIETLQGALKSLTEALTGKADAPETSKTYRVKAGDSLEKIAKLHHTTVQAIKELNQLNNDKIRINQTLHIP